MECLAETLGKLGVDAAMHRTPVDRIKQAQVLDSVERKLNVYVEDLIEYLNVANSMRKQVRAQAQRLRNPR